MILASLVGLAAHAQDWDAAKAAQGWARVDRDGSMAFYDAPTRTFRTWVKDGGALGTLDASKLPGTPEKWVMDSLGQAWTIVGTQLIHVEKGGKLGRKETLPGEVADVAWDAKGFFLSYRTATPYVEKRDFLKGSVTWSYGKKPEDAGAGAGHRIASTDDGGLLVLDATGFTATLLEGAKGRPMGNVVGVTSDGAPAPGGLDATKLGAVGWWLGHNVLFRAVPGSLLPSAKLSGLVLVRLDVSASQVDFLPTGVTEDHVFLGVTDTEAVFQGPGGGLVFVPVK